MLHETMARATTRYLIWSARRQRRAEDGFEVAQSMGIALMGLVVAAAFTAALQTLGVDIISKIRTSLELGG